MIKKIKQKLKKMNNRGSSFVLVIVTTTFLSILISSLLLATLLVYKLKFYKLNSLNNFYSVEKAMDEIYAGIGSSTNEHLYTAYTTTAEFVVTYDTANAQYTNMDNAEANELFKKLFMQGMLDDDNFKSMSGFQAALASYVTVPGVDIVFDNLRIVYIDENDRTYTMDSQGNPRRESGFDIKKVVKIAFENVCVKREIEISNSASATMAGGTYEQSITTDIILSEPEYNVSFDMAGASGDSLYNYAILADMGIEVLPTNDGTDVKIKGNVYAANDYYNKDYNDDNATKVTNILGNTTVNTWGAVNESAYSGIYVSGDNSTLSMNSDIVVCPGTIAVFDGADVDISGRSTLLSELWTDNIVIGGEDGGSLKVAANAYVYDDTELNAEESSFTFTDGTYFGYSYNAEDLRSVDLLEKKGRLLNNFSLRSHYSDSAIIVNGKNSTLDLRNANSVYIAGKSYIEFSKVAANSLSDAELRTLLGLDADAALPTNLDFAFTTLNDYSTGTSLDVKSNQLIFLSQWAVDESQAEYVDENGYTHVQLKFPSTYSTDARLQELYEDFLNGLDDFNVEAIKETVSGHDYYYLYITDKDNDGTTADEAEEFCAKYYDLLLQDNDGEIAKKLYNVVNYESFDVTLYLPTTNGVVDDNKVTAAGGVTAQANDGSLYYKTSSEAALTSDKVDVALKSASTSKTFRLLLGNNGSTEDSLAYETLKSKSATLATSRTANAAESVSDFLTYMYINMKDHLSVSDKADEGGNELSAWEVANYQNTTPGFVATNDGGDVVCNYSITPLTNFVDYEAIFGMTYDTIDETVGDSRIIISKGDVNLYSATGDEQGIIICGGNVNIDSSVKTFRGIIICGGKVYCTNDVSIAADATYVGALLDSCYENLSNEKVRFVTQILKNYTSSNDANGATVDGVSISDISYEDILLFENWKKNVE